MKLLGVLCIRKKLIGVFSKKLSQAEQNYPIMEKEALGIYKSLIHFKPVIYHSKITVLTDHSNLKFLDTTKAQRSQRWRCLFSDFNLDIKYIPGEKNVLADGLSRNCLLTTSNQPNNKIIDKEIRAIHEDLAHPGVNKLLKTLRIYKPINSALEKEIIRITKDCIPCQRNKNCNVKYGALPGKIQADYPFQKLQIELYGPIDTREFIYKEDCTKVMILSVIDVFCKYVMFIILEEATATEMCKTLIEKWLHIFPFRK